MQHKRKIDIEKGPQFLARLALRHWSIIKIWREMHDLDLRLRSITLHDSLGIGSGGAGYARESVGPAQPLQNPLLQNATRPRRDAVHWLAQSRAHSKQIVAGHHYGSAPAAHRHIHR